MQSTVLIELQNTHAIGQRIVVRIMVRIAVRIACVLTKCRIWRWAPIKTSSQARRNLSDMIVRVMVIDLRHELT